MDDTFTRTVFTRDKYGDIKQHKTVYRPSKMSMYALGRSLLYLWGRPFWSDKEHQRQVKAYTDTFIRRSQNHIIEAVEAFQGGTTEKKPKKKEKDAFKKEVQDFSCVIRGGLQRIIRGCLDDKKNSHKYFPTVEFHDSGRWSRVPLNEQERQLNEKIFSDRLRKTILNLSYSDAFNAVLQDYRLVNEVVQDPSRFSELEELCRSPLKNFMTQRRIRYMDEASQYQEGLLVVWACTQKYEARDFARFPTMVRKGLHYKFCNLLAFYDADCRRTMRNTHPMGDPSNPDDTALVRKAEKKIVSLWAEVQEAMSQDPDSDVYDPFMTVGVLDPSYADPCEKAICEEVAVSGDDELVTHNNFPHLNENYVTSIDKKRFMQNTYLYNPLQIPRLEEEEGYDFGLDEKDMKRLRETNNTRTDLDKETPI